MREDERETLADIIQNIDEQEIFLEFITKAETIKESWQIAKIFENKKKEFIASLSEYDTLIKSKESELRAITAEINDANNLLKDANAELDSIKAQLEEMRAKAQFYKTKIMQGKLSESLESSGFESENLSEFSNIKDEDSNILDFSNILHEFSPLSTVSVHIKNGATAMARAAQVIYEEALYEVYKMAGKRLYRLKDRINELELANKKLSVELRDLSEEDNFKENMRNRFQDDSLSIESKYESSLDSSLNERMSRIDKKKEKVEEMFQQLNDFLKEESKSEANINDIKEAIQDTIKNINRS